MITVRLAMITVPLAMITVLPTMITVSPTMITLQRDGRAKRDHDFGVHRTTPKS
jgi:hypothetical protein